MSWRQRATAAERAIGHRHLRPVAGLPHTVLGCVAWPPDVQARLFLRWGFWWQAHLLDCLLDAQQRDPSETRTATIDRFVNSLRLRNFGSWLNDYYDDIAWLGLALQRIDSPGTGPILRRLRSGWSEHASGGIWWRRGDTFKNAPANGPAAIMHARAGETERAVALTDWLADTLLDPDTGLILDGIRTDTGRLERRTFTYCQGVFIGACVETGQSERAAACVHAVAEHLAPQGIVRGGGRGDGGLFPGILTRYLALAARRLDGTAADVARGLVLTSAEAAWRHAAPAPGGPLFGPDWSVPAPRPEPTPDALYGTGARDLSVQLSGWMVLEAAATLPESP